MADINGSEKILSYDEIVLFGCDRRSLGVRAGWLTDNVVNFAANYLKNNIIKEDELKDKVNLFDFVSKLPLSNCKFLLILDLYCLCHVGGDD
jgi:hypothetical protein